MHAEISVLFQNDPDLLADFSVFLPDVPGAPSTNTSTTSGLVSLGQAVTDPIRRQAPIGSRSRPAEDNSVGQPPAKKKRSGPAAQPLMESAIASTSAAAKAKPAAAPGENKKPAIPKPTTSAPRKRYVQYDLKQCAGTNTATAPHQLASRSQPRSRLPVQSACHLACHTQAVHYNPCCTTKDRGTKNLANVPRTQRAQAT